MSCFWKHIVVLISILLLQAGGVHSQEKVNNEVKVERFWLNANHGFNKYNEVGVNIQFFKQLLVGAYFQSLSRNVGPGVPTNPYAIIFSGTKYKQDRISSGSLMIGFVSPTPHSVMISFLAGPSLNKNIIHSDFETIYSSNGYYPVAVSSSISKSWKVGLNYKATLSFIIRNRISINLGLAGNYNGIDNYNRFILGIGIGEFGCFDPLRGYREVKKYDR